ncbi:uncharacterized protein Z519_03887 [Cladophialophora bantiana CBS 173.52]|uniref:Uncharacterized protein n=1 Tax=Cladophialophora bantiana (strain ATCC 10958 / CBS 173.52 / CDC B-1940 / NIH 8579) TaxID=1442370 RepID=A0A0D2HPH6_CLAB1|nr:uncharacterized protein Z519_03887 [Cladophialophora bantiana CBS 173.52]KIW95303.1 hypothetical protein Z519_03887 [Cladophialophora bantiana CBS 173.52]
MSNYLPLHVAMSFLMVDAVIEVGFVGSMVGFLHDRAGRFFTIDAPNGTFDLHGKPKGLLVDQGHTSNGAAGTALVLVGFLGLLTIWNEKRRARRTQATNHSGLFVFWVVMTVLSALLTLAALIYTFVVTAQTDDQTINLTVAAANPEPLMYPLDKWTPENWFVAVLALPLAHASDRRDIRNHLRLMRGWRWNLIPLFILGVVVAVLAVWELVGGRKWRQGDSKEKLRNSTQSQRY